jgi:hypothetical protein
MVAPPKSLHDYDHSTIDGFTMPKYLQMREIALAMPVFRLPRSNGRRCLPQNQSMRPCRMNSYRYHHTLTSLDIRCPYWVWLPPIGGLFRRPVRHPGSLLATRHCFNHRHRINSISVRQSFLSIQTSLRVHPSELLPIVRQG